MSFSLYLGFAIGGAFLAGMFLPLVPMIFAIIVWWIFLSTIYATTQDV